MRGVLMLLAEGWDGSTGGVQRYLRGLMSHVKEWKVVVVGNRQADDLTGVEVYGKRFHWWFLKPSWLPLWVFVRQLVQQKDPQVLLGGKALFEGRLLRKLGRPYALFTYAMEIETWLKEKRGKRLASVLSGAAKVFYMNTKTKQRLLELGVRDEQLVFLPPAVDSFFLEPVSDWKAQVKPLEVGPRYILTAGRLVKRKGFDVVLEAFFKLDVAKWGDVQLIVAGDGPERGALEGLWQQLYLDDGGDVARVKFVGRVSDKQLRALYAGCEFFVSAPRELPGDLEGFGIVFLEAAAAGRAVLATRTGGVVGAVADGESGLLVSADDAGGLAAGMEQLLQDTQLRGEMGKFGRKRVEEHFTWQKQAAVLESALEEIV